MEFLAGDIEISGTIAEMEIWKDLEEKLQPYDGIIGYKIPAIGNKEKYNIPSFFLRSQKLGIVLIDVVDHHVTKFLEHGEYWGVEDDVNNILSKEITISNFSSDLNNRLKKSRDLYDHRKNDFVIPDFKRRCLLFYNNDKQSIRTIEEASGYDLFCNFFCSDELDEFLAYVVQEIPEAIDEHKIDVIDSILESTDILNRKFRLPILTLKSQNDFVQKSLINTFKLDETQRKVALQLPNGPQRVRGLAGTGKTIILCLKAALAHKIPDLKILFVFNTQSMYNQITSTIQRYYNEDSGDLVNWENIKVFHAWGGKQKEGLYSYLCNKYNTRRKTFFDAKGKDDPYEYIFDDFLSKNKEKLQEEFDLVLIDEAQDFPPKFFETIFYITKNPKRIIWAYDEFQSLKEMKISSPSEIFGNDADGQPNLPDSKLDGFYSGNISKDFILPNSYRNPRKVLMYAHGLGMGLYSKKANFPMKDRISWQARGYEVLKPTEKEMFDENDVIEVERPQKYSKNNLESLIQESGVDALEPLIQFRNFGGRQEEANFVISKIDNLINEQGAAPEEIIVICLNTKEAKSTFNYIRGSLNNLDQQIYCITPGFVERTDLFKEKGRVTLTTAFRAKGNEANFVFVMSCNSITRDLRLRNSVFVSITRSRGWTYLSGVGKESEIIQGEINEIENNYPFFRFTFPSDKDYQRRLQIISREDNMENRQVEKTMDKILLDEKNLALLLEKAKDDPTVMERIKELLRDED